MEAMASLAHSSKRIGFPFPPSNRKAPPGSAQDVACVQSTRAVFVNPERLYTEHQHRFAVVNCRSKRMKYAVAASRADCSVSSQSDGEVAAEHLKRIGRFVGIKQNHCFHHVCHCQPADQETISEEGTTGDKEGTWSIQVAISALQFYKREISPLLPGSCRYVPTCSEYSMQAYRTYGVWKGTILTACRIARCNPLGGSGFDPPRWFGESKPPPF